MQIIFWMALIRIPQFWHCSSGFLRREYRSISAYARGPDSFQFLFFSPSLLRLVAVIATSCRKNQAGLIIWRLIFLAPVEFSNNSHTWHHQTRSPPQITTVWQHRRIFLLWRKFYTKSFLSHLAAFTVSQSGRAVTWSSCKNNNSLQTSVEMYLHFFPS